MSLTENDYAIRPVWSILSKGRTGTGKTIASCGKEFRPVYVFNMEGRMESVIRYYKERDGHAKDIIWDDYHMGSGFYTLDQKMDEIMKRPEYKTVVAASLTSYIHIILKHLLTDKQQKFDAAKRAGQQAKGTGRRIGGIPVNVLEDYNAEDSAIIFELCAFLQELKNMGTNVILEAHISPYDITTIDEESGARQNQTFFQILTKGKKAPAQIPGYFNEVYLFEKKFQNVGPGAGKPSYFCNTVGSQTDECKTSFGIESFEWTDKDCSELLVAQLSEEVKNTPREDPNKPKAKRF